MEPKHLFFRISDLGKIMFSIFSICFVLAVASPLNAHNLWIVGDAEKNGNGAVHLYFEHHVGPGDGSFVGPILKHGKTWLNTLNSDPRNVELKEIIEGDLKYLGGTTGKIEPPFSLDHKSLYGIYHGRMDFFYGRYIQVSQIEELAGLAESPHLPFQIVPVWNKNKLSLRIMFFSNPYPRAKIYLLASDGTEKEFIADNKGEISIPGKPAEVYHFASYAFENDAAGVFEYDAFKGIMYGSTLILKLSSTP